jgi:RHS repeat-associated protein
MTTCGCSRPAGVAVLDQRLHTSHSGFGSNSAFSWNQDTGTLSCVNPTDTTCPTTPSSTEPATLDFTYNADGLRTKQASWNSSTSSVATTLFTWNSSSSALLSDGNFLYIYGLNANVPIAQFDTSTSVTGDLVTDTNSNVRAVIDLHASTADTLTNYVDYDSYGNPISKNGGSVVAGGLSTIVGSDADSASKFGFGGGYLDASALIYLVHRYYDPTTGQFVSVDPALSSTGSPFSYAGDNPVGNTDFLGRDWLGLIAHGIAHAWNDTGGAVVHGLKVAGVGAWHFAYGAAKIASHFVIKSLKSVAHVVASGFDLVGHFLARHWKAIAIGAVIILAAALLAGGAVAIVIYLGAEEAVAAGTVAAATAEASGSIDKVENAVIDGEAATLEFAQTEAPTEIAGTTPHGYEQIMSRDGVGVSDAALKETVNNPLSVQKVVDSQGRISFEYVGKNAFVVLNKYGQIVTAYAKNRSAFRIPR